MTVFALWAFFHWSTLITVFAIFFTESEHYLRGMIFEDVTDDEKEEYPVPSYTTLGVHSPASAASASNFPSGTKTSSGIIFNIYFSLFLLLKNK